MKKISRNFAFIFPGQGSVSLSSSNADKFLSSMNQHVFNSIFGYSHHLDQSLVTKQHRLSNTDSEASSAWAEAMLPSFKNYLEKEEQHRIVPLAALASSYNSFVHMQEKYKDMISADVVLGHSLGEFTALVAAGILDISGASKVVRLRADLMAAATSQYVKAFKGIDGPNEKHVSMIAVFPLSFDNAGKVIKELSTNGKNGCCEIGNVNADDQIVFTGTAEEVEKAAAIAKKKYGGKKTIKLEVPLAFHSTSILGPCEAPLSQAIKEMIKNSPKPFSPIISNINGDIIDPTADNISHLLGKQVHSTVHWSKCVDNAIKLIQQQKKPGPITFLEFGGNGVLSKLMPRIKSFKESKSEVYYFESGKGLEELDGMLKS